jgi:hypothetical protein
MTEADWLSCTNPEAMLRFLDATASERRFRFLDARGRDRKRRLFACACCRRAWEQLRDQRLQNAVEVAERYAEGLAGDADLDEARIVVNTLNPRWRGYGCDVVLGVLAPADVANVYYGSLRHAIHGLPQDVRALLPGDDAHEGEAAFQCDLLRCLFGNPFRVSTGSPAWRNATVQALARAAAEERSLPEGTLDPFRLAVLADALEEAGCTDGELLGHLRRRGPHVLGCWVIDQLLA